MGKSCGCGYVKVPKVCFDLELYAKTYTVGATTDNAGNPATLAALLGSASAGGYAVLTPLLNYYGQQQTAFNYTGLNLVGGRFNAGTTQTGLGVAGITSQLYNGSPRLVIPAYAATAGGTVVTSLVNAGLASGTAFVSGLTVTLYFAKL